MTTKSKTLFITFGTLLIGIIIGFLLSGTLRQERENKFTRMRPNERFRRAMERIIRPTDEQRELIQKTLKRRFDQIAAIREQHEDEIFTLYDSLRLDMDAIRTTEQKQRLEEHLERGPHLVYKERNERLAEELKLTSEQKEKITKIMDKFKPRFREHFEGRRNRKPGEDRQSRRSKFEKMHEEIKAILTPEQIEKYQQILDSRELPFGRPDHPPFDEEMRPPFPPDESPGRPESGD